MITPYIDAHLHLQDPRFDGRRDALMTRARSAGIGRMVCNSVSENDWSQVAALAQRYNEVVPCYGVHPWFAEAVGEGWQERLVGYLSGNSIVGEIGLDGLVPGDMGQQERVLRDQLELAVHLQKIVVLHCVKKWGRLLELLHDFPRLQGRCLFHSFGGAREILHRFLDMGAFFSFSCSLAHPKRHKLRQAFLEVPVEHLFLETDAPDQYCADLVTTHELDENRLEQELNEPVYVANLYAYAARLKKRALPEFRQEIWKNGQIFTH